MKDERLCGGCVALANYVLARLDPDATAEEIEDARLRLSEIVRGGAAGPTGPSGGPVGGQGQAAPSFLTHDRKTHVLPKR